VERPVPLYAVKAETVLLSIQQACANEAVPTRLIPLNKPVPTRLYQQGCANEAVPP